MTQKEFLNNLANGKSDVIQEFLDLLEQLHISYCVIGGLAVNAYVEPVVSLDLDLVIATESLAELSNAAKATFKVKQFPHSLNLSHPDSELRIQLQTDERYQKFVANTQLKVALGYEMYVATLEDVLQGKIWVYSDPERRASKRQKDLADILRIVESYPGMQKQLPKTIINKLN